MNTNDKKVVITMVGEVFYPTTVLTSTAYGKVYEEGKEYRDTSHYAKRLANKRKGSRVITKWPRKMPIKALGEVESTYAYPYRMIERGFDGTVYTHGQTGGLVLSENRFYARYELVTPLQQNGGSMRKKAKFRGRISNSYWSHDPFFHHRAVPQAILEAPPPSAPRHFGVLSSLNNGIPVSNKAVDYVNKLIDPNS